MKPLAFVSLCVLFSASINFTPLLGVDSIGMHLQQSIHVNIEGLVSVDGKAHAAVIEIYSLSKNQVLEKVTSHDKNGIFKTGLLKGDDYELVVRVPKFPPQVLLVSTKNLESDKTLNVFADFTSPAYDHKLEELKKSIDEQYKKQIKAINFEEKYGKVAKENMTYKIQVGAFRFYENFNYTPLVGLPKIIRKIDSDFITRFTIGNYSTYHEALQVLKKVQAADLKEAFIVAYYHGERKALSQLLSEKILD